jgi:hypothetical protein
VIDELPSSGIAHDIKTLVPEIVVTGASGLFGTVAAKILSSPDKAEYPTELRASTLNL